MNSTIRIAIVLLAITTPLPTYGQLTRRSEIATRAGMEAIEDKDWDAAVERFQEAQRLSPWALQPILRLAMAHERADNMLPAISWYRAYLAVAPETPESQEAEVRVRQLEELARRRVQQAGFVAQSAFLAMDKELWFDYRGASGRPAHRLMDIYGRMGDRSAAASLEQLVDEKHRDSLKAGLAIGLAQGGDLENLLSTAETIANEQMRSDARLSVLAGLIHQGQIDRASRLADELEWRSKDAEDRFRFHGHLWLGAHHARSGRTDLAESHFDQVKHKWRRSGASFSGVDAMYQLGAEMARAGEVSIAARAANTLSKSEDWTRTGLRFPHLHSAVHNKGVALRRVILREAALMNDANFAKATAKGLPTATVVLEVSDAAIAHFRSGNADGADDILRIARDYLNNSELTAELLDWPEAVSAYAAALTWSGEVDDAKELADRLEDASDRSKAIKAIAAAQRESGDWKGAVATARTLDDAKSIWELLRATARQRLLWEDIQGAMQLAGEGLDEIYLDVAVEQATDDAAAAAKTIAKIADRRLAEAAQRMLDAATRDRITKGHILAVADAAIDSVVNPQDLKKAELLNRRLDGVLRGLAIVTAANERFAEADFIAMMIGDEKTAAQCMVRIAAMQREHGRPLQAQGTLRRTLDRFGADRPETYLAIAEVLTARRDAIGLRRLVEHALHHMPYRNERPAFWRIAKWQQDCGDKSGGETTRELANSLKKVAPVDRPTRVRERQDWILIADSDLGRTRTRHWVAGLTESFEKRKAVNLAKRVGEIRDKPPNDVFSAICDEADYLLNALDHLKQRASYWKQRDRTRQVWRQHQTSLGYHRQERYAEAISHWREATIIDPQSSFAHNQLAKAFVTCPDQSLRNTNLAIQHATLAADLSHWQDHHALATLAAAYAADGDYDKALEHQRAAVDRTPYRPKAVWDRNLKLRSDYYAARTEKIWSAPGAPGSAEARSQLEGEWLILSVEQGRGDRVKRPSLPVMARLVFRGDQIRMSLGELGADAWDAFRVDPAQTPKHIDVRDEDRIFKGLYQLNGDELVYRHVRASRDRPKSMDAKLEVDELRFKLLRFTEARRKAAQQVVDRLQGGWIAVSGMTEGVDEPRAVESRWEFTDGEIRGWRKESDKAVTLGPFAVNASTEPYQIDIYPAEEDEKEAVPDDGVGDQPSDDRRSPKRLRVVPGVFEFDGDLLRICFAENESSPRPTSTTSLPDSDQWSVVFKRSGDKRSVDLTESIRLNPKDPNLYYERAHAFRREGRDEQAIDDLSKSIELKPDFFEAYLLRGKTYAANAQDEKAVADFDRGSRLQPEDAELYFQRGKVRENQRDREKAIADYSAAINRKADYAEAFYRRGRLQDELEEHETALADMSRAIELRPDYADAYRFRSMIYFSLDKHDLSEADYIKSRRLRGERVDESPPKMDEPAVTLATMGSYRWRSPDVALVSDAVEKWLGKPKRNAAGQQQYDRLASLSRQSDGRPPHAGAILREVHQSTGKPAWLLMRDPNDQPIFAFWGEDPEKPGDWDSWTTDLVPEVNKKHVTPLFHLAKQADELISYHGSKVDGKAVAMRHKADVQGAKLYEGVFNYENGKLKSSQILTRGGWRFLDDLAPQVKTLMSKLRQQAVAAETHFDWLERFRTSDEKHQVWVLGWDTVVLLNAEGKRVADLKLNSDGELKLIRYKGFSDLPADLQKPRALR